MVPDRDNRRDEENRGGRVWRVDRRENRASLVIGSSRKPKILCPPCGLSLFGLVRSVRDAQER